MSMHDRLRRSFSALLLASASLLGLAACSTTGNNFDSSAIPLLVHGQTNMTEASQLLRADPVNVYRQQDGSAMAIWSHKLTLATDAVYFNQELWLAFGPDGSFRNIVKSVNIPRINEYGEQNQTVPYDTRVRRAPAANTTIYPEHSAGAVAVEGSNPAAPSDAPLSGVIHKPAFTYPVSQ